MDGPLVDIVLLGLLVIFFGIQQRSRPQLYFRYWFAGWIMVFLGFLAWEFKFIYPGRHILVQTLKLEFLLAGGQAFLLSFVVRPGRERRTVLPGLLVALPASALFQAVDATEPSRWMLYALIFLLEVGYIRMASLLLPKSWLYRRSALGLASLVFGFILFATASTKLLDSMDGWLLAQLFCSVAILYAATGPRRSLDRVVGTLGFAAWGMLYPLAHLLQHSPGVLHVVYQLWDLPKYGVGFAMTLRIFDGARNDMVRLADGYKLLYEDFRLLYEHHPLPMWIYDPGTTLFLSAKRRGQPELRLRPR